MALLLATLLTPLGTFECPSIRCQVAPPDLEGYFTAGQLWVTVHHRPLGVLPCVSVFDPGRALEEEFPLWLCGYPD